MPAETSRCIPAEAFFEAFISAVDGHSEALRAWNSDEIKRWDQRWTAIATDASAIAIRSVFQQHKVEGQIAAKGHPDRHGGSEYFTLDAIGYMDDWSRPLIAVEHENSPGEVSYAFWKLLCIDAGLRVLICYIDPTGKHREYKTSEDGLMEFLREVLQSHQHQEKKVVLIIGKWEADPGTGNGWKDVYALRQLPG